MLKVSDNRRFLVHDDGTPFFYLGDTAWELLHRCTLEEIERYLADRAAKGFTVIQTVVLAELDGLHTPNRNGDLPLFGDDPTRPNAAYFAHVDAVVALAGSLGLHLGLLPTWGDKWNQKSGVGPVIFTPENARIYGAFLGRRYAHAPIIWIVGGDRPIENEAHRLIVRALAEGLRDGDGGKHLITMHTWGPHATSEYVHDEPWLDFHTCQSGHARNSANWRFIEADYARTPTRPCMDAEPGYEDMADNIRNLDGGYLDDWDARKALYWSLFAGAHGHTYGCNPVWQMWSPGRDQVIYARRPWYEAMHLPGSSQMQHARNLLLSRPFLTRIPDQSLIASTAGEGTHHVQATRDSEGRYAMVYVPAGNVIGSTAVELDLTALAGEQLAAWWYDPRTGVARSLGVMAKQARMIFVLPQGGPDWVLVLDDAACGFPAPGRAL
jgi:hypothetical protein